MLHQRRRPLLAGVMKVQHTLITLADAAAIHISEQCRRVVRQRGKQVFGLARLEPQLRHRRASTRLQLGMHGMLRHESI